MKVVLAGTKFGLVYLRSLAYANEELELAGLLCKGGERSRSYAKQLDIPSYTSPDDLPSDIDLACVVVRGGFLGGEGTTVAAALLQRGIHVLQEHPLHSSEIRRCKDIARDHGVRYHVNAHFANVEPVVRFVDFCATTAAMERPDFLLIETGLPYSALDIVGRCLGSVAPFQAGSFTPWAAGLLGNASTSLPPYDHLPCLVGGIPTSLHLQGHVLPGDEDNNFPILHRISLTFPSGTVTLTHTQGPVVWHRPFSVPEYAAHSDDSSIDTRIGAFAHHSDPTSVVLADGRPDGWADVVTDHWPRAVARALEDLQRAVVTGEDPFYQTAEYLSALSRAWHDLLRITGGPEPVESVDLPVPPIDPVRYAAGQRVEPM